MEELLSRINIRLNDEAELDDVLLLELLKTSIDRSNLRVGDVELSPLLNSIAVDLTVKMYRRIYFEGIKDETADSMKVSFVDDLLKEYDRDLAEYQKTKIIDDEEERKYIARFY